MTESRPDPNVVARLALYFQRNGYVRIPNVARRKTEKQLYKKGAEVRLVAETEMELTDIRDLLTQAGFKLARSFEKAKQWRQPIYGMAEVARFLALIGVPAAKTSRRVVTPKPRGRGRPGSRFMNHIIIVKAKPRPAANAPPPAPGAAS